MNCDGQPAGTSVRIGATGGAGNGVVSGADLRDSGHGRAAGSGHLEHGSGRACPWAQERTASARRERSGVTLGLRAAEVMD
jgi:hypothetical protein